MTDAPQHARLEWDGPLAVITFQRPPLNLWDDDLAAAMNARIDEAEEGGARGLLFRAEGRVFTGGVDVNSLQQVDQATGDRKGAEFIAQAERISALPFPTVLAAHALCLTWGFEVAMACDILLATEEASFALVEAKLGLAPFMGGPQRLALRAGPARAKEFVMTGDRYDARTLERWGVVNQVLPTETFDEDTHAFALALAHGPTRALALNKRLVDTALSDSVGAADDLVRAHAGEIFASEDTTNALISFLADGPGKATFEGR